MKMQAWKKVDIAGNLLDDGENLDGLVGIEVLEDPDVVTNIKRKKLKTPLKEKKKITKKKKPTAPAHKPGRFVLLNPNVSSEDENEDGNEKKTLAIDDLEGWTDLGLDDRILQALADRGFKSPTLIQALTLPPAILENRNILGAAETGSGKTLAFGIPIIEKILKLKLEACEERPLYALILTPTRELAVQIKNHLKNVLTYTDINVVAIFGGLSVDKQDRLLKKCPEIVVATPGRFWDLLKTGNSHLSKINELKFLVIDETDRMLEKGHFAELKMLIDRFKGLDLQAGDRQTFIFSATLTNVHDVPKYVKGKKGKRKVTVPDVDGKLKTMIDYLGLAEPKIIDITQHKGTADKLTESRILCRKEKKDNYLYYFLKKHPGRTLVFCNSIDCVRRLAKLFGYLECKPLPIHASMIQKQRLKSLEKFTADPLGLLIATDVAARGLDIPNVQHVIHYQVPKTSENYIHRSGRTARGCQEGISVLLIEPEEVHVYSKIYKSLGREKDMPIFPISETSLLKVQSILSVAREVDKMSLQQRRSKADESWRIKAAEEADILLSDGNESDVEDQKIFNADVKRELSKKQQELSNLLATPLFSEFNARTVVDDSRATASKPAVEDAVTLMKNTIIALKENKNKKRKFTTETV